MAYTTNAKVRTNSGFTSSALVADAVVDDKIAYADGMINAKIAGVYALPLTVNGVAGTPSLIAMLSLEMATVLLLMSQYSEQAQDSDKGWEKRLKVVQATLDDIAELKSRLFDDATGVEYTRSTLQQMAHLPSRASEQVGADPYTPRKFGMDQKF